MFTQVKDPKIVIYDGETNKLIGTAEFSLTTDAEQALLELANYGIKPSSLILMNVDLYQPAKDYVPPTDPFNDYKRESTIYALLTESLTGNNIPIEIKMKYKVRPRVIPLKDSYYLGSTKLSDIKIESVETYY